MNENLKEFLARDIQIVESKFIPEGVSVLRSGRYTAILNHASGRAIVYEEPNLFTPLPPRLDFELPVEKPSYRFLAQEFGSPVLLRPSVYIHPIIQDIPKFKSRWQTLQDSARCRRRHSRARRQGGKGR